MSLQAVYQTEEEIPENLKTEYVEKTVAGKTVFVLDVKTVEGFGFAFEDVSGLRSALNKERKTVKEKDTELLKFKDIDPVAAKSAIDFYEENKDKKDIDVNALLAPRLTKINETHAKELKDRDDKFGKLTTQLEQVLIRDKATTVLASRKANIKLLLPIIEKRTKTREDGDHRIVEVLEEDGTTALDSAGNPMTIESFVDSLKADASYAGAFEGVNASGSGDSNANKKKPVVNGPAGSRNVTATEVREKRISIDDIADGKVNVVSNS